MNGDRDATLSIDLSVCSLSDGSFVRWPCRDDRYAARAKKIVNVAEMNEVDNLESFMDNYWNEVDALRRQVGYRSVI